MENSKFLYEEIFNSEKSIIGKRLFTLMECLFPICRSITGNGVRDSLKIIKDLIPIDMKEVPTGTQVFDWMIPKEWNIRDAYVKNSKGEKIIDFKKSNLHVVNYSIPVSKKLNLKELKEHLFTLPDFENWIPYLTTYYKETWGFCISHRQYRNLEEDTYDVVINSTLEDGFLTYGEYYLKGEVEDEIIFSCYVCHPSMCNDNLSGVSLLTFLAKNLTGKKLHYSYRFLFIPETIGSITWLKINEKNLSKIKFGLISSCIGDSGNFTYKKTRDSNTELDKIVERVLIESGEKYSITDFDPTGSDERQFSSPGFNIPMGVLSRSIFGSFKEYHTSADNLDFMDLSSLEKSFFAYLKVIYILENNSKFLNTNPKCEPQLGKRGIYSLIGSQKDESMYDFAIPWVLNLSDGNHSLFDITVRSGLSFDKIKKAADVLFEKGLLQKSNY